MKITICRNCEDSNVKVQPLGFNYTKDNAPSYMLVCQCKKDRFGLDMECRYVRQCPKGKDVNSGAV